MSPRKKATTKKSAATAPAAAKPRRDKDIHERHKFKDFRKLLPKLEIETIFDIGANVGQTVGHARRFYPNATIYAFEPVGASYANLVESVKGAKGIRTHNVAVGAREGEALITADGTKPQNRLVPPGTKRNTESVEVIAGGAFCEREKVDRINFLKIDTEGHDLDVLRGFQQMLGEHRIDLIQVEAGMTSDNELHVPFQRFMGFLEPMGYHLFRIYEQKGWRKVRGPELGFANPVFISEENIAAHME